MAAIRPPIVYVEQFTVDQGSYSCGKRRWTMASLKQAVIDQDCEVFDLPLSALHLGAMPWDVRNIDEFVYHAVRMEKACMDNPIILDWRGFVADGWHRIAKAIVNQQPTIRAYRLKKYVTPDFDGDKPDGSD